jgi:hypothetical protein
MLSLGSLVVRYGAFAAIATVANILAQAASLIMYYGPYALELSILTPASA